MLIDLIILMQVCKNETDYERWSVPNEERCLLGRNITITRRKRNSTCFNGKGWQRPEGIDEHCDCDWVSARQAYLKSEI